MGEGEFLVHGADVDDLARRLAALQMPDEGLRDEERALEVGVQDEVVVVLGDVPERGVFFDAGVVDEDVDLAEAGDAVGDEFLRARDGAEIGADGDGAAAELLDDWPSPCRPPRDASGN